MIKDIVVNLSTREDGGGVGDYAVSLADVLGAHIAGIAFVFDPIVPISGTGYIPAEVIETQLADNQAAAKAAIDRFAATTARTGVSAEPITLSASAAGAGDQFARIARRFDLAIVPQAEPQGNEVEVLIAESTLFQSGRPMIVVPYIQKAPLKLDRVMVCWDGGRQAARAIADAMPILEKAGKVEVVIVADERGKAGRDRRRRHGPASGASRAQSRRQAHQRRQYRRRRRTVVPRRRQRHGFHRHGRLRPFPPARVHTRRRDAFDPALDDGAGAHVALNSSIRKQRSRMKFLLMPRY